MSEDGREENRKQGGFKTMPLILGNEICDRFASTGFNANLITYLTQIMHMPMVEASNVLTNFSGTSSLTPIIGALIADSFAGRFWSITVGLIIYLIGMISLTISAVAPSLHPPPCAEQQQCQKATSGHLFILYTSLLLTAIGSGGIRPCVVPFGADQLELKGAHMTAEKGPSFFNLYFFSMGFTSLLALTLVVYIQDNVGWGWGFGIPTIVMALSIILFVVGYPFYIRIKPAGSPMTRLTQVMVAAIRKRNAVRPDDVNLFYQDKELDADLSITGRLVHTDQLKFFDRAAIVTDGDMLLSGRPKLWRLSTVHRVEELKAIMRMLPIWIMGIILIMALSHNGTFAIQQGRIMDRRITSHFQFPAASISIFTVISMLTSLTIYDRVLVPLARRYTKRPTGITYFQRMGIGLVLAMLSNVSAALVETKRKNAMNLHGVSISVFWLVPQFSIHGFAETFFSVGQMEFVYHQAPESMRSSATALFWLGISLGYYMGTALVTIVHNCTKKGVDWLPDDLNKGKLDSYYWLVTAIQIVNIGYYLVCSKYYKMKTLEAAEGEKVAEMEKERGEEKVELGDTK
ncbi:hypothetical protein LUZ63_010028 [Rhynchospora breviuscula]|uniref:Uncharacterized protein n=1 Tax=Rhynchospora breviuscula TaxID=2022672 RepID=A0A9Q0HPP2_9POAL|nr:hypothetical protein LUZ63_010028 [Rhynchospora breviuscula]